MEPKASPTPSTTNTGQTSVTLKVDWVTWWLGVQTRFFFTPKCLRMNFSRMPLSRNWMTLKEQNVNISIKPQSEWSHIICIPFTCQNAINFNDWGTWYPHKRLLIWWKSMVWYHGDVIKWKHFPHHWTFVRGIHRSSVNSPHKGQWRGALMYSLIGAWINDWVNNGGAGDLRRHRAHCDVTVIQIKTDDVTTL